MTKSTSSSVSPVPLKTESTNDEIGLICWELSQADRNSIWAAVRMPALFNSIRYSPSRAVRDKVRDNGAIYPCPHGSVNIFRRFIGLLPVPNLRANPLQLLTFAQSDSKIVYLTLSEILSAYRRNRGADAVVSQRGDDALQRQAGSDGDLVAERYCSSSAKHCRSAVAFTVSHRLALAQHSGAAEGR